MVVERRRGPIALRPRTCRLGPWRPLRAALCVRPTSRFAPPDASGGGAGLAAPTSCGRSRFTTADAR